MVRPKNNEFNKRVQTTFIGRFFLDFFPFNSIDEINKGNWNFLTRCTTPTLLPFFLSLCKSNSLLATKQHSRTQIQRFWSDSTDKGDGEGS